MSDSSARAPGSVSYTLVLTHDVDELGLRGLRIGDRRLWALVKALTLGATRRLLTGRLAARDWVGGLSLLVQLPWILLGLARDPLQRSIRQVCALEAELGVRSTFYFLPFPGRPGLRPDRSPAPVFRACRYRLAEQADLIRWLHESGWETGVHGIDSHVSPDAARKELTEIRAILGPDVPVGCRMHWLYSGPELRANLRRAGYAYDATFGSNDNIGFPEGRCRPFVDAGLPVLPLAVQDVTLLREDHLGLKLEQAWQKLERVLAEARERRAVLTVLWHNDSFVPPRSWQRLYVRLLERALADGARVVTAGEAVRMHLTGATA